MISVVINCHNGSEFLAKAIESVLQQTDENWEMVFWDNASAEDVKSIVLKYDDQRVRYFRDDHFSSLGIARNKALKEAKGDYIAFLDADDYWMPEKLAKQIMILDNDQDVGLVYTDAYMIQADGKVLKKVLKGTAPPEGLVFGQLLSAYFLVMSSVMIRREALEGLNEWFDSRFEIVEEYDVFLRIAVNWKLSCVNEVLSVWRWHSGGTTMRKRHLISLEKRLLLKKLNREYPDLMINYQQEVDIVRGKILISNALTQYYSGKSSYTRSLLRKSKIINLKGVFVYCASFLPIRMIDVLYRKIKGNPLV